MSSFSSAFYQNASRQEKPYKLPSFISPNPVPKLLILLTIIIVLLGTVRIGKIVSELTSGIKSFKEILQGNQKNKLLRSLCACPHLRKIPHGGGGTQADPETGPGCRWKRPSPPN
jgi:hypothetical protein